MDYGDISLPKSPLPRMEMYDTRTLSKQILAETQGLRGQTPCRVFGAGKVSTFIFGHSSAPVANQVIFLSLMPSHSSEQT
jgi:hypothetical protein